MPALRFKLNWTYRLWVYFFKISGFSKDFSDF